MLKNPFLDPNECISLPKHVAIILHDRDPANHPSSEMVEDFDAHLPENYLRQIVRNSTETSISHLTLICPNAGNITGIKDKAGNSDIFTYLFGSDPQWLIDNGICLSYFANRNDLSPETLLRLKKLENCTAKNHNFHLTIAAGYDGSLSILNAVTKIAILVKSGDIDPDDISPDLIGEYLHPTGLGYCNSTPEPALEPALDPDPDPDPDLIIITGGIKRLDNTCLWQSAYSEFVFCETPWNEFSSTHFFAALTEFTSRERRFGGLIDAK